MRLWVSLVVVVLVVGCGKNRPMPGTWPAQITSHTGFTDEQWNKIQGAVDYMNTGAGKKLIYDEGEQGGIYPIYFKLVENGTDHATRAGLAIFDSETCTIEVSTLVFMAGNQDTLIPVINHELGHCAGLEHDPQVGQIMYQSATNLKAYTRDAFSKFFTRVEQNIGM